MYICIIRIQLRIWKSSWCTSSALEKFDFVIIEIKMIHLNFHNLVISLESLNCNFGKLFCNIGINKIDQEIKRFLEYWNQSRLSGHIQTTSPSSKKTTGISITNTKKKYLIHNIEFALFYRFIVEFVGFIRYYNWI